VFIGNATRVDDARPDIEGLNPTKPFNYRGGWGYLALTNFFPNQGNGTFVISVYATDKDGHETFLGSKTITANNTASTEPFGAIDTPQQGETVTGTINNFGWVLVQGLARADPPHGGRVQVVVDGAVIGSPTGWAARGDIQALFPKAQYSGVDNALGVLTFNTAVFQDGVHTISWNVFANNGQAAGIGSRFFSTVNGNSLTLSDTSSDVVSAASPVNPFANLGRQTRDVARLDATSQVHATTGYSARPTSLAIASDATGLRTVYGSTRSRVVVDASTPGTHRYEAYLVADGTLRPLPIGSAFDDTRGVLAWQPGLGFNGSYDFLVVRDGQARIPVRVVLTPDSSRTPAGRLMRGIFAVGN
jgi:hypothetical protein